LFKKQQKFGKMRKMYSGIENIALSQTGKPWPRTIQVLHIALLLIKAWLDHLPEKAKGLICK